MTTSVSEDVITACTEAIASHIEGISAVKKTGVQIYSPDQILTVQQKLSMPAVLYHYAGIQKKERSHLVVFFIYFIIKSQSVTATKNSKVISTGTEVLQEIRKSLGCAKSPTKQAWVLDSEVPIDAEGDKMIYRQRWSTGYHISN